MEIKLENKINAKNLLLIFFITTGIYISLNVFDEEVMGIVIFPLSVMFALGVAITGLIISKQYSSKISGRAFLALSIGFFAYVIAELLYYSLDYFGFETYPSIADVFFFAVYPFICIHLILNIRFFLKEKLTALQKFLLPAIPISFITIYGIISFSELEGFDFWYGLAFVSASSVTLSLSVLGALIFKKSYFGTVWLLLSVGILLNAVGDVWYYHLEIFGTYTDQHVVNVMWFGSNMIMIYALLKHRL